jgi:hypothetical protein
MPAKSTTKTITCQNPACGRTFLPESHANRAKFCCMECWRQTKSTRPSGFEFTCQNKYCGKVFGARQARPRKFCSRQCWELAQRGSRHKTTHGYVVVNVPSSHHLAFAGKCLAYEHRLVMERKLGRRLEPGEEVHHKNGNKADNRPENLELAVSRGALGSDLREDVPSRNP